MKQKKFKWLALLACLLTAFATGAQAGETDDLQAYLDQLATSQVSQQAGTRRVKAQADVVIPVGLPEIDLSMFTSNQDRSTTLTVKTSVKFINGAISSNAEFVSNGPLLKITSGAEVVIDATASVDASTTPMGKCAQGSGMTQAVGIYGGSTLYQQGDITAPSAGEGEAIHLDSSSDTYIHTSGAIKGSVHNPNGGTVVQPVKPLEIKVEDDLQAYLNWLSANRYGEAQSSEEQPQQLDLKGRTIIVNNTINIPVDCHLHWTNGTIQAGDEWKRKRMFYVPGSSSLKLENLALDYSQQSVYVLNDEVVTRWLFDVEGMLWLGSGFQAKGWLDNTLQPTDDFIPGAGIRTSNTGRIYLAGGQLTDVVLVLGSEVNIFISASLTGNLLLYLPTACRQEGFRLLAPWNGYRFTLADLKKAIKFFGVPDWLPETDANGYVTPFPAELLGDADGNGRVRLSDAVWVVNFYISHGTTAIREARADITNDAKITLADAVNIVNKYINKQ